MKTASFPALRVEPELRERVERLLRQGENLSTFIEAAVTREAEEREEQSDFEAEALASWEEYARTGEASPAAEVFARMDARLAKACEEKFGADAARELMQRLAHKREGRRPS